MRSPPHVSISGRTNVGSNDEPFDRGQDLKWLSAFVCGALHSLSLFQWCLFLVLTSQFPDFNVKRLWLLCFISAASCLCIACALRLAPCLQ